VLSCTTRAGQGSPKPANPHRPAPICTDPAGFLVFFAGCGLDFNFFAGRGGLRVHKKNLRGYPPRPAIYNLPKKCPSLSHFLTTHSDSQTPLHSPATHDTLKSLRPLQFSPLTLSQAAGSLLFFTLPAPLLAPRFLSRLFLSLSLSFSEKFFSDFSLTFHLKYFVGL
jgi:hypothetical protein